MTIVAHAHPFVIGVDTHARTTPCRSSRPPTGEILDDQEFPTTPAGFARAIAWVARRTGGDLAALWVIECAATFGAQLAKAAAAAGYQVVEAARMSAKANRGLGKSDPLDARRIATAVLSLEVNRLRHLRKDDGTRAALRVVIAARTT